MREQRREIDVLVRATPGVDPQTHRLIRTGQADTKFGFNIADGSALAAVKHVLATPGLRFRGIHCHIGSQLLDSDTHAQAAEIMVAPDAGHRHARPARPSKNSISAAGWACAICPTTSRPRYDEFAERLVTPRSKPRWTQPACRYPKLLQEPGRALVGEAGTTLYTIGAIKTVPITEEPGTRTYVAIDGGMSDNPRPQLYEAVYECLLANKADQPADTLVTIAGKHCETDILIWNTHIAAPQPGDILAVQTTGAYNYVMASNYNRFLRPAVVLVADGQADLIVERQNLET